MNKSVVFAKLLEWDILPLYAVYWQFTFIIFFSKVIIFKKEKPKLYTNSLVR